MQQAATFVLSLDQGTTSSRAIVFDEAGRAVGLGQQELPQIYPKSAWVEHDPEQIFQDIVAVARIALAKARISAGDLAAIGITNQRETIVLWERGTGRAIGNAIVWQDRRTAAICSALQRDGAEALIRAKTGLVLDPYFSGTKIAWALDHYPQARSRAEAGEILAGTIDSWLLYRLTGGRVHATDATNASRTMLFDIHKQNWCPELCALLRVPIGILPEVMDSAADFGVTDPAIFGAAVPIAGIAGDQQAAAIGQACFAPGMIKATYGTGCFILLNTGSDAVLSQHRLLTTVAYRLNGQTTYALEGSIFVAGASVQWLRDGLGIISQAAQSNELAKAARSGSEVYLVPAFTGLGAPYWDADARGAILGLTRDSGPAEIALAALEAVGFQSRDLVDAMAADMAHMGDSPPLSLRVDGGMAVSDFTMQTLANLTGLIVERPAFTETTAYGAAMLAGMQVGAWGSLAELGSAWALEQRFVPALDQAERDRRFAGWRRAVARILGP
jgi:glycerol kinase